MDGGSVAHSSIRNQKLRNGGGEMVDHLGKLGIKRLACSYEVGDVVWGKVRSHPWWLGQILHDSVALPCVSKTKKDGCLLVAFFGDNSYGWFDPFDLLPFDIRYVEKSKQINDVEFLNAAKDAEDEAPRMAALGLSCWCQGTSNFQTTGVKGFVEVDVCGYQPGAVYSVKQIKNARHGFQPTEMRCFLKKLASIPHGSLERSIHLIKNEAFVLAYRKAVFEEDDETYPQAYGLQQRHGRNSIGLLISRRQIPSEALPSVSELKASFARFGQLHSPSCMFWRSSTCQVRFKCKSDAEAAFAYAVKNRPIFGNMRSKILLASPGSFILGTSLTGQAACPVIQFPSQSALPSI